MKKTEDKTRHFFHMTFEIDWIIQTAKEIGWDKVNRSFSAEEAKKEVFKLKENGYRFMPLSECEGFDPFDKGCSGHTEKPKQ